MPVYDYKEVYENSNVHWTTNGVPNTNVNNGVPIGSTFTVTGGGSTFSVLDDDLLLEDNTGTDHVVDAQSRDGSQQTLVGDFLLNSAGDYVWSRAYQEVTDSFGNVGRIYQVRMGNYNYNGTLAGGIVDYNTTNIHQYYVFSGPLVIMPGATYTVTGAFNGNANQAHQTFEAPVCFVRGARIATAKGMVAVEELKVGDLVRTRDNGLKPILWIGSQAMDMDLLAAMPHLRAIRIRAGALGDGLPQRDLCVSPQHRVVVRNRLVERMFDTTEVLVAAKHLLELDGIEVAEDLTGVEYVHFLLDQHEIVLAEGVETESLYTGPQALKSLSPEARREVLALFPELATLDHDALPARAGYFAEGRRARRMAERAARNGVDLLADD